MISGRIYMRIQTTFDQDFEELYNRYNINEKGKALLDIEGISRDALDIGVMSKKYFTNKVSDISLDANSNSNDEISHNNYSAEIVKGLSKLNSYYLLHNYAKGRFGLERANELLKAIFNSSVYFHDAASTQIPYCMAYSTSFIMNEGRKYGQLQSLPPKRASSFLAQVIETTMDLSQNFAGAIAVSDLIVNLCYYTKKENLDNYQILNLLQGFVHVMSNKFRVGGQSPFTNLSIFDRPNLEKLFEHYTYPDGTHIDIDYVLGVEKSFAEWFAEGDPSSGLPYRFPICTINLACDKDKNIIDKDFLSWISKVNLKNGTFNLYINDGNKIASCCRLLSDKSRMEVRGDSFGNGGLNIGSHRVVTINLPRISLKANKNKEKFFQDLNKQLEVCRDLLLVHREEILQRRINQGFLKFFKPLGWFTLDRLFSTFGIIGICEMNYFMGFSIQSEEGIQFTTEVLNFIEDFAKITSKETHHSFNVEEIPGESVASKLVEKDKILFGEDKIPFQLYSNQYIPLITNTSLPERIELTGKFQDILSGGGILHLNIKDKIEDPAIMQHLIEYAVSKKVSHLAVNYSFGNCENDHVTVCGNSNTCSICGGKILSHMTRIVGYFTLTDSWSHTRREYEFPRRVFS
jgi:ribonucleoside-triphosphate reductase (formate)